MKKFFPYILIVIIFIGLLVPFSSVFAQLGQQNGGGVNTPASLAKEATVAAAKFTFGEFLSGIFWLIMKFCAFIMGIGGYLLDRVIEFSVINMSSGVDSITGINTAWKIIRDLMNIAFIFILLYEAIRIILSQSSYQSMFKRIGLIILSALLINFSLFFTKILIDASNVVTIGFYQSITGKNVDPKNTISTKYQTVLGLQGFFSSIAIEDNGKPADDGYVYLVSNIMASILFLIVAFVFFAMSILFIVRYIVLIFLLALSPIAYMGWALPEIKKYSGQWWESFKGQLLFGPIFMLFTWVTLTLISAGVTHANLDFNQWGAIASKPANSIDLIFNFAVIIGLAVASLIVSKQTATQGSKMIGDLSGRASAFAGGVFLGGTARFGRNTIGRAGSAIADNEYLKNQVEKGGARGFLARQALIAGDKSAKSTFDVRGTDSFKSLSKTTKMDFGKASDPKKSTFQKIKEDDIKKYEERAKLFKSSDAKYDEAKTKDSALRDQAKKDKESEAWKAKTQAYFNSDEWKNSELGKAETEAKTAKENFDSAKKLSDEDAKKLADLEKKLSEAKLAESKDAIKLDIEKLREESEERKKATADLEKLYNEKKAAIDKGNEERKKYENAEKDSIMKMAKDDYKPHEGALNTSYQNRVNTYASGVTQRKPILDDDGKPILDEDGNPTYKEAPRWRRATRAAFGSALNVLGMNMPRTQSDRDAIARKVKGVVKGKKSVDDRLKEILKDEGELKEKEEEKPTETKGEAKPEAAGGESA